MKHYLWAIAGLLAISIALPSNASFVDQALRSAVGVRALTAPLATIARTPPVTEVVGKPAPAPAPQTAPVVTDSARQQLLQAISQLSASSATNAAKAASIVLVFVIAAMGLGALASIAGFLKASMIAGVLSILATATVGANNALPFRDEASTYKYVSAESSALFTQAQLDLQMTEDRYNRYRTQLLKLATYGDSTAVSGSAEDLTKFLQSLHVSG